MNADNSFIEFFYNIVPGSLFVVLLKYYKIFDVSSLKLTGEQPLDSASLIFLYIALGLLFGFVFQGMTKLARKYLCLNVKIMEEVKKNNKKEYDEIDKTLKTDDLQQSFYLMDNYLRGEHVAFLINHFSARFAFWSNIFFALISLLFLIATSKFLLNEIDGILITISLIFSWIMLNKYFLAYYDSVLKSFYMRVIFTGKKV